MKAVVQRVSRASVRVAGVNVAQIGAGMLILVCALQGDCEEDALLLAEKLAHYRFFEDQAGRMQHSAIELGRAALVVSQFTLAADGRKGRRPSFDRAMPPAAARALISSFSARLRELGLGVAEGQFGAQMEVELVNDGPVTFVLSHQSGAEEA